MEQIGLLYWIVYKWLKQKSDRGEITKREMNYYLGKFFLVPKEHKPFVIKELESFGLLEKRNSKTNTYIVKDLNLEKKLRKRILTLKTH